MICEATFALAAISILEKSIPQDNRAPGLDAHLAAGAKTTTQEQKYVRPGVENALPRDQKTYAPEAEGACSRRSMYEGGLLASGYI